MCDPGLTSYVSELLVDFTHIDRFSAIRNAEGKRLDQVAAMLAVASEEESEATADRDLTVYRRIGDYTLFWTGLYPEQLGRARCESADLLLDYVAQGKRSYSIVSDLAAEDDAPPSSLFRRLSEDFEFCIYGLGLVRKGWEQKLEREGGDGHLLL